MAESLGKYLTKLPNRDSLLELELCNNGLKDLSSSQLLAGVSKQETLKKLHISKNEIGQSSGIEIVKIIEWSGASNL